MVFVAETFVQYFVSYESILVYWHGMFYNVYLTFHIGCYNQSLLFSLKILQALFPAI